MLGGKICGEQIRRYNAWIETAPPKDPTTPRKKDPSQLCQVRFKEDPYIIDDLHFPDENEKPANTNLEFLPLSSSPKDPKVSIPNGQNSTPSPTAGDVTRAPPVRVSPGIKSRLALFESPNGTGQSIPRRPLRKSSSPTNPSRPLAGRPPTLSSSLRSRSELADSSSAVPSQPTAATTTTTDPVQQPESPSEDCWKAVRLRVIRQEDQLRRAVAGARRSLHLNVHAGGGEVSRNLRSLRPVSGPVQGPNAQVARPLSAPNSLRFAVASEASLLETSLVNGLCTRGLEDIMQLQRAQGPEAIIEWFRQFEAPRLLRMFTVPGPPSRLQIPVWFHGILKRKQAEMLLSGKAANSFLLRVSESFLGYVISHMGTGGVCTHFFVQISKPPPTPSPQEEEEKRHSELAGVNTLYHLFGLPDQIFPTLSELIKHHTKNPLSVSGSEMLLYPVGQEISKGNQAADYVNLLFFVNPSSEKTTF
ncbi:SH2 domain containing 2A [Sparganum proliferum]